MGVHGPIAKRAEERRRRNKVDTDTVEMTGKVDVPPANEEWHPIAVDWYESLAISGQHKYYEPSDWAAAQLLAAQMTLMLMSRPSPTMFAAVWSAMGDLLTTEGERRRVRLEVNRKAAKPAEPGLATVTPIDRYAAL